MLSFLLCVLSATSKLIVVKRSNQIEKILQDIRQRHRINDFLTMNEQRVKNPIIQQVHDAISKQILLNSTCASLCPPFDVSRYLVQENRLRKHLPPCTTDCPCMKQTFHSSAQLPATDRVLLVCVLKTFDKKVSDVLHRLVKVMYNAFATAQSTPKMLCITILNRKFRGYKSMLSKIFYGPDKKHQVYLNVDVLQISLKRGSKRDFEFNVYQFDPFARRFLVKKWKSGFNWFPDKLSNCHGHELYKDRGGDSPMTERISPFPDDNGWKLINKMLNISVKNRKTKHYRMWIEESNGVCGFFAQQTQTKPTSYFKLRIFVPVIYDELVTSNWTTIILNLLTIATIVFVFWLFPHLCHFDSISWSTTEIFQLILGGSTSRLQMVNAQVTFFLCAVMAGFFFGGELTSGLASTVIKQEVERQLETFKDLRDNNITVYLMMDPKSSKSGRSSDKEFILKSRVNYVPLTSICVKDWRRLFAETLIHRNVSFSSAVDLVGLSVPEVMIIDDKLRARKSNIVELIMMASGEMHYRNDPFLHRLSDVMWRMGECGIRKDTVQRRHLAFSWQQMFETELLQSNVKLPSNEQVHSTELEYLWIFVFTSTFAPIIVLVIEIIYK